MIIIRVYNINMHELRELLDKMPDCFLGYELNRIKKFRKENDQKRSLIGKIAIADILSEFLNIKKELLIFDRDKYDRPYLKNPKLQKMDFNISHSGDYVLVGFSSAGKIGVDIEKIKAIDMKIANNVFRDEEIKYLHFKKEMSLYRFYRLWSLKESFVKAVGEGLSYPLKKFHFEFENGKIIHKIDSKKSSWNFKTYEIEDYKISVCTKERNFVDKMNIDGLF